MRWRFTEIDRSTFVDPPDLLLHSKDDTLARANGTTLTARGHEVLCADKDANERWAHRCTGVPVKAYMSGDRVLVLTNTIDYHAWGFLGPALLLNAKDGTLIKELRGARCVPLEDGNFMLGLEGYDVFDTWLYDRTGALVREWHSYGHYAADPDGSVRVIECDRRGPTRACVVRLLRDGTIERGAPLIHGQVSAPLTLADGTMLFVDAGALRVVERSLAVTAVATLVDVPPGECWRFFSRFALLASDRVEVDVVERTHDVPIVYTRHRFLFALTFLGEVDR